MQEFSYVSFQSEECYLPAPQNCLMSKRQGVEQYNWSSRRKNTAGRGLQQTQKLNFLFWKCLLLSHSKSFALSLHRRPMSINWVQLVTAPSTPCCKHESNRQGLINIQNIDSRVPPLAVVQFVSASLWKQRERTQPPYRAKTKICLWWEQKAMNYMSPTLVVVDMDVHGWITSDEHKCISCLRLQPNGSEICKKSGTVVLKFPFLHEITAHKSLRVHTLSVQFPFSNFQKRTFLILKII